MSATRCEELVERVRDIGRPTRVLYVSDFDPAGQSMPVAAARKIEFFARGHDPENEIDEDIQIIPVVLTQEQCVRYMLPRTPIKETESRAARFESMFGEGATELDALEALHPGELRRILTDHIHDYYDVDIEDRLDQAASDVEEDLQRLTAEVWDRYAGEITALEQERQAIAAAGSAALAVVQQQIAEMERAFEDRAQPILDAVEAELDGYPVSAYDYEWPEPKEGLEHDDPLFDSTRPYVEQIARYHEHQGREPELILARDRTIDRACAHCRTTFSSAAGTTRLFCSKDCMLASRRAKREVKVYNVSCSECGKSFAAKRSTARVCGGTCQARLRVRRAKEEALPNRSTANA